jgi:hypothetical protein
MTYWNSHLSLGLLEGEIIYLLHNIFVDTPNFTWDILVNPEEDHSLKKIVAGFLIVGNKEKTCVKNDTYFNDTS